MNKVTFALCRFFLYLQKTRNHKQLSFLINLGIRVTFDLHNYTPSGPASSIHVTVTCLIS
jgi:hypothetical protein